MKRSTLSDVCIIIHKPDDTIISDLALLRTGLSVFIAKYLNTISSPITAYTSINIYTQIAI